MVVDNQDDIMFLDIISSSSSPAGGGGGSSHESPAAAMDEDDGNLFRFDVRVRLMDRLVSMHISPPTPGDDGDTPTSNNNVDPQELDYPCPYPTCYWSFASHDWRMEHIARFHFHDEEEKVPTEWNQLDPSIGKDFLVGFKQLDLIQEILQDGDFDYMGI